MFGIYALGGEELAERFLHICFGAASSPTKKNAEPKEMTGVGWPPHRDDVVLVLVPRPSCLDTLVPYRNEQSSGDRRP